MATLWACPHCKRTFRRANTRHQCGTGDPATMLRDRPAELALLFGVLESNVRRFGPLEIAYRDRYALFRTTRIFADLVVMRDALRLAIHANREMRSECFFKIAHGEKGRVSHVAKLRTPEELRAILPYLEEAYRLASSEEAAFTSPRKPSR